MKLESDIKFVNKDIQTSESNSISHEDKTVWFIWFGLIFIAVAALPFIARVPSLVGVVSNFCISFVP